MKNPGKTVRVFLMCCLLLWKALASTESAESGESVASVGSAAFSPRFASQGDLTLLDLRGFQQTTDFSCGPAALVTLLDYYSILGKEIDIASDVGTVQGSGTHPVAMTNWLNANGFEAAWGEAPTGAAGLLMLRNHLKAGIPTLVEWIDWGGDWVVVVGYDTKGTENPSDDDIIFADPYDHTDGKADGLTFVNAEKFLSMWFDANCFERHMKRVYVIARPRNR